MTRTRWTWALLGAAGIAGLVAVAGSGPTTAPEPRHSPAGETSTSTPAPTPDRSPTAEASDGDGLFGGLLEDLLGGIDPSQLAACVGVPEGPPQPLPTDTDAAIDAIAAQVARERQLAFTDPVDPQLLPPAELSDRIVTLSAEDYPTEVADVDGRVLAALGAVPPGTDLRQLQLDLLGGQVAGFYDPETGELTALAADGLDPTARMTLAHELDHALTDQAIGLPDLAGFDGRSDEGLAALAVIEGDASLLMQRWATQQLTLGEQLGAATASLGPAGQLQSAPWLLQQQLVFPYTAGLSFACEHFAAGGWDAVDALYASPPTTSAQVLWPERYARGESAVDVTDPPLPDGYDEVRRDQLGAADLLWLFQAPGDDRSRRLGDAEDRAAAWAGGELAVGTQGDDTVVSITLAERPDAEHALCDSVGAWYAAAFPDASVGVGDGATTWGGDRQSAALACRDAEVRLTIAPDVPTALSATGG